MKLVGPLLRQYISFFLSLSRTVCFENCYLQGFVSSHVQIDRCQEVLKHFTLHLTFYVRFRPANSIHLSLDRQSNKNGKQQWKEQNFFLRVTRRLVRLKKRRANNNEYYIGFEDLHDRFLNGLPGIRIVDNQPGFWALGTARQLGWRICRRGAP